MLKCIAKCSKGYDRCCFNCELKDLCDEVCALDPKKCEYIRDTSEVRAEKRERNADKRFWRLYIFLFILTLSVLIIGFSIIGFSIIGNQNYIMVMLTDVLNNQNTIMVELDKESIDPAAENRSEVNSDPLGMFTVTHYCSCEKCCGKSDGITATGTVATEGRTIAVDPDIIPLGSKVLIDGQAYIAEDVGGAIKGNKVDIYVNSHQEAVSRGKVAREVFVYFLTVVGYLIRRLVVYAAAQFAFINLAFRFFTPYVCLLWQGW